MKDPTVASPGLRARKSLTAPDNPFHHSGNMLYFYGGAGRSQVLEQSLQHAAESSLPLTVHGPEGCGKTLLSQVLEERASHRFNVIRYDEVTIDNRSLLRHLCAELCPILAPQTADDNTRYRTPADRGNVDEGNRERQSALRAFDLLSETACLERLIRHFRELEQNTITKPVLLIIDTPEAPDHQCQASLRQLCRLQRRQSRSLRRHLLYWFNAIIFQQEQPQTQHSPRGLPAQSDNQAAALPGNNTENVTPAPDPHRPQETAPCIALRSLTLVETGEYLHHYMMLFDYNRRDTFSRDMVYFIADRSNGNPGEINALARNAFMLANLENAPSLGMGHLLAAGLPAPVPKLVPWYKRTRALRQVALAVVSTLVVLALTFGTYNLLA